MELRGGAGMPLWIYSPGTYCDRIFIMDGQKMPTITSKNMKATSCTLPLPLIGLSVGTASPSVPAKDRARHHIRQKRRPLSLPRRRRKHTRPIAMAERGPWALPGSANRTGTKSAAAEAAKTHCMYTSGRVGPEASREQTAAPAMQATMKQAKIMPWGICSPLGLRAGVQRNTKVYIEA